MLPSGVVDDCGVLDERWLPLSIEAATMTGG